LTFFTFLTRSWALFNHLVSYLVFVPCRIGCAELHTGVVESSVGVRLVLLFIVTQFYGDSILGKIFVHLYAATRRLR